MGGNNRKVVILQDRDMHLLQELGSHARDRPRAGQDRRRVRFDNARERTAPGAHEAGFLRQVLLGNRRRCAQGAVLTFAPRGRLAGVPHRRPRRGRDQVLAADSLSRCTNSR